MSLAGFGEGYVMNNIWNVHICFFVSFMVYHWYVPMTRSYAYHNGYIKFGVILIDVH